MFAQLRLFSSCSARNAALVAAALFVGAGTGCSSMQSSPPMVAAHLSASTEVPANTSAGTGDFSGTLDKSTGVLSWKLSYSGLTGPATSAHFHGPATAEQNAAVVVAIKVDLTSPIEGRTTLTSSQADELIAGRWYVNVHTAAHPAGEIRGQLAVK